MPAIPVSDQTLARLKTLAEPFVDTTPESVIVRALDALEALRGSPPVSGVGTSFDSLAPPNLSHTKVLSILLDGERLPPKETYWNYLLFALVNRAAEMGKTPEEIIRLVAVNAVRGKKSDMGYRHLPKAGISVQGQDAMGAWRGISSLARALRVKVEVTFTWLNNPKAAKPGEAGRLVVDV